jgi:hypothetical protein
VTGLKIDGWRMTELGNFANHMVHIDGASEIKLANITGSCGTAVGFNTLVNVQAGDSLVDLRDYTITQNNAASSVILYAPTSATCRFYVTNGTNPNWQQFSYGGANTTFILGSGVTITGTETFTAGKRTIVNTTTT